MGTNPVRVGCSGWSYLHWRGPVYSGAPARTWLRQYAERFDTVEINSTFYRLPKLKAVAAWVDQTPDGFCFAVKASRYLTHIRRLADVGRGFDRLLDRLMPLVESGRLGPVLWQLPSTFVRDDSSKPAQTPVRTSPIPPVAIPGLPVVL